MSSTIPRASLKQKPQRACGPVRPSKRAVWRAVSLILVHLAIAIHILHWKSTGRTLSPVEPSEAMKTLELGYVNAGFVLFLGLILLTVVFGRFFCGWACHLVAYQDLCGWILKKLGLKPKPFRSRLLVLVPLFAAFYMFIWPQVQRVWAGRQFPALAYHLTTEGFWDTFPTFWIAALTFGVCGFLIVCLLGNKGFCTYGCPYGAFFFYGDRLAPGRILVNDDCNGCGHCTATCTSNVRVHEEVRDHKMVVDAGCMKCMDCVSVCPNNALRFGFAKPALFKGKSGRGSRAKFDFTWPEELAMAGLFLLGFYAFRGLYEAIPFLLSIGLSSICAFLILQSARALYAKQARASRLQLRSAGRTTVAGWCFAALGALLLAAVVHSAIWQYHWHEGNRLYAQAQEHAGKPEGDAEARASVGHYGWCRSYGLFEVADLEAKLGSGKAFLGDVSGGIPYLRRAVDLAPNLIGARYQLASSLSSLGQFDEAAAQLRLVLKQDPKYQGASGSLAQALVRAGKPGESLPYFRDALAKQPHDIASRMAYGMALAQSGDAKAGEAELEAVVRDAPNLPAAHYNLALLKADSGLRPDAEGELLATLKLDPKFVPAHLIYGELAFRAKDYAEAAARFDAGLKVAPNSKDLLTYWAESVRRMNKISDTLKPLLQRPREDAPSWLKVIFLYRARGANDAAAAIAKRYMKDHPDLPVR